MKLWFDPEGDYLEVTFSDAPGHMRETNSDAVMQRVYANGRVTIDLTLRESARAKIKVLVKRILRKHGYPPDFEEEATKTVLAQAELLCAGWAQ